MGKRTSRTLGELEAEAASIREGQERNASAIRSVAKGDLENAPQAGEILAQAKELVPHGSFMASAREHLGYSKSIVGRYTRLHRYRDLIGDKDSVRQALRALSEYADKMPRDALLEGFKEELSAHERTFLVTLIGAQEDVELERGMPDLYATFDLVSPWVVSGYWVVVVDGEPEPHQQRWLEGGFGDYTVVVSSPKELLGYTAENYVPGDYYTQAPVWNHLNGKGIRMGDSLAAIKAGGGEISIPSFTAKHHELMNRTRLPSHEERDGVHLCVLCPGCGRGFFFNGRKRTYCTGACYRAHRKRRTGRTPTVAKTRGGKRRKVRMGSARSKKQQQNEPSVQGTESRDALQDWRGPRKASLEAK